MSIGGGWEVLGVTSLLVTVVVATSADPYPFRHAGLEVLWTKSYADYLGTLPRTEAMNEYILMMEDSFTKWLDCAPPLPNRRNDSACCNQ